MEHFDNFTKMISGSLGLTEPWYIEGAEFIEAELSLHIHVGVHKTAAIMCPKCGGQTKRFGYEKKGASMAARGRDVLPVFGALPPPKGSVSALRQRSGECAV